MKHINDQSVWKTLSCVTKNDYFVQNRQFGPKERPLWPFFTKKWHPDGTNDKCLTPGVIKGYIKINHAFLQDGFN